ncbi:RNA dependent RNA polymerase [Botrytis cinerea mitovirus 2]|uniref:RNA dependent RNA polymerase n=1 Tax=Botrytis cinerea mitovirus 2 TaxID=1629665 RepID=A0A0S4GA49_9VIRU|nr:RNA dependent RNA polymerase [Botrytis cinerea mitovirus 2]CEZ26297.1 RNA dependent RNA polymerase [Botrytis cinerea mitovirus 2]
MKTKFLVTKRLLESLFDDRTIGKKYIKSVETMRIKSGLPFTIKYMKAVKLHITRYISGQPLRTNSSLVSLTNGFPTKFLYLKELIDSGDPIKLRLVLTLTGYTRSIIPTKDEEKLVKPTFNSISDPYKGKENYTIPTEFINGFVEKYKLNFMPKWDNSLQYISNKSSPFGKSTLTGPFALFHMGHWNLNMLDHFKSLIGDGSYKIMIGELLENVFKDHRCFHIGNSLNGIGKIAIVKDPELKQRAIAMVDYYSQLVLRPIHDGLLNKLRNLPQDRTFTQNPFNNWGKTMGNSFWSLDLSSATDRFPISLQEKVLASILKDEAKAETWRKILIERDYKLPNGNLTRYSVGQPMGAYSSWTAFTISHHLVVHFAAHLCGIENFDKYILLGDDIVINNDKVARKYIKIMTKLGVDISINKTHVSKNTYEFAKRWVKHNIEITGIPLRGILNNLNSLPTAIKQLVYYFYSCNTLWRGNSVELIFSIFKDIKLRNRFITDSKLRILSEDTIFVIRQTLKLNTYEEIRNYFNKKLTIENVLIPNEDQIHGFIRVILCLGLNKVAEKSGNDLSKYYKSFEKNFRKGDFDLKMLVRHPIVLGIYNKISQMKRTLQKVRQMDELDLIDAMTHMRIDEPDKLVQSLRNTSRSISHIDQLWKKGFKRLEIINEDNYVNFNELDLPNKNNLKPWESYYISNLSELSDKLDSLKTPVTQNMWF